MNLITETVQSGPSVQSGPYPFLRMFSLLLHDLIF